MIAACAVVTQDSGAIVLIAPFSLASSTTVLLLLLLMRISIVLPRNVTTSRSLFNDFGLRDFEFVGSV